MQRICFAGLLLCLAGLSRADQSGIPVGDADWELSPTDPVGFAGQGNKATELNA
jgi:hypothetical protein